MVEGTKAMASDYQSARVGLVFGNKSLRQWIPYQFVCKLRLFELWASLCS